MIKKKNINLLKFILTINYNRATFKCIKRSNNIKHEYIYIYLLLCDCAIQKKKICYITNSGRSVKKNVSKYYLKYSETAIQMQGYNVIK